MQYLCILIAINLASYIATIYLSHILTVEDYSQIVLALTVSSLVAVFSLLGRSEVMLRRISQSDYQIPVTSIISSIALSLLIYFIYFVIYNPSWLFLCFLIVLTIIAITVAFSSSTLKYQSKTMQLAITQKANNIYKLIIALVCLYGVLDYSIVSIVSISIMLLIYLFFFFYHFFYSSKDNYQFWGCEFTFYDKEALPFLIDGIAFLFYFQASIFVFGYYEMDYELAVYSLALLPISAYTLVFNGYFNSLIQSKFYKLSSTSKNKSMTYLKRTLKYQSLAIPLIVLSYLILVFWLAPLLFDLDKYPNLIEVMLYLTPVVLFKFYTSSLSNFMNLKENIRLKNVICIIGAIVGFIFSLLTIKLFAVFGAVISTIAIELYLFSAYFTIFLISSKKQG